MEDLQEKQKKRPYYGWLIVLVNFFLMALLFAPNINLAGLYVLPLCEEFGSARTIITTALSMTTIGSVAGAFFAGRFLGKHNLRITMTAFLAVSVVCFFLTSFATSVVQLYILGLVRGFAAAFLTTIPSAILVNNWFGKRMRGKAVGLSMVGSGIGAIVLSPVTGFIIESFGWRMGYRFFGLLSIILIPLVLFIIVRTPEEKGLKRIGDDPAEAGKIQIYGPTAGEALKTPIFWMAVATLFLGAGIAQSWVNVGASFLSDVGYTTIIASAIISGTSVGVAVGKPLVGAIADKKGAKSGFIFGIMMCIAGYVLLTIATKVQFVAIIGAAVVGIGMANSTVSLPLITGELFGNRDFSTLVGYVQIGSSAGSSLLPILTSVIYDGAGHYVLSWMVLCALSVCGIVIVSIAYSKRNKYVAAEPQKTTEGDSAAKQEKLV